MEAPLLEFLRQRALDEPKGVDLIIGYLLQRWQIVDAFAVHEEGMKLSGGGNGADERTALLSNYVELLPMHVRRELKENGVKAAAAVMGVTPYRLNLPRSSVAIDEEASSSVLAPVHMRTPKASLCSFGSAVIGYVGNLTEAG